MVKSKKLRMIMNLAETVATGSHDSETKVGAVLVRKDTGAIIATGCNGFVRGAPDDQLPTTRPDKYDYIVHAETNLIANCCLNGISTRDCILVCTLSPCGNCMRLLWQAGISQVIVKTLYRDYDKVLNMKDLHITHADTIDGYHALTYKER